MAKFGLTVRWLSLEHKPDSGSHEGQARNLFHDAADGPLCSERVVLGDIFANVIEIA